MPIGADYGDQVRFDDKAVLGKGAGPGPDRAHALLRD